MIKKISLWVGIIVGISVICGGVFKWQDGFVKAESFKCFATGIQRSVKGNTALIQKINVESTKNSIQNRIWKIEDRYPDPVIMPPTVREELRNLRVKLIDKQKELKTIEDSIADHKTDKMGGS